MPKKSPKAPMATRTTGFKMSSGSFKELGGRVFANWSEDAVPRLAASFSFYAILSLAPLLILAIAAASTFIGEEAARKALLDQVGSAIGKEGRGLIETLVEKTFKPGATTIATILSLIVTFFSASGLFMQLSDTVNAIWGIPADKKTPFFKSLILTRVFAFAAVLVFGIITLGWLAIDFWLQWLERKSGGADRFAGWPVISTIISIVFLSVVFAISYKQIPRAHAAWRDVWLGAAVAAVGVGIAKYALGLYFKYADVAGAFGPAGALVLILLWIYYTSQIYFFGAEIVYSYAHTFGSRAHMEDNKSASYS